MILDVPLGKSLGTLEKITDPLLNWRFEISGPTIIKQNLA
jgi:hypothetical protein